MEILVTQDKQAISSLTNGKAPKQTRKRRKETVKYALTGEDFPDVDDIVLVKVLHPLYVCSRIFGMIWKEKEKFFDGKIFSFDLCTVHCFILLLTAWFNAFQFFASYDRTDVYGSVLFQKVSVHIFNFQLACGVTSFVFYHYRHMPNFIKLWENYKIRYGGVLLTSMRRTLTLKCIWINVVNIGLIVFFQLYLFIKDTHLFVLHNLPFFAHTSHESKIWLLIFFGLLHFYLFMAWIQSLINIICITKALRDEFSQLSQDLRDRLCEGAARSKWPLGHIASPPNFGKSNKQKERNQNNYQIEVYRQRHFELCKLVRIYDDVASSYLFFLYLFSIPVLVLVMYVLWGLDKDNFADNLSQLILSIISLVFFVAILISITVAATSLNIAAKEPKDMLHSVDLATCRNDEAISIQVFLQRLAHEHLGFTIWKCINIDKTILLTMFTIVVSYLTLMLRFAIALGSTTILMNVTMDKCPCLTKTNLLENIT